MLKKNIENRIYEIRGQLVMLDFDLAELYAVETKVLKQNIKRNLSRFPKDFMFELTQDEFKILRSQFVTSSWGGRRYLPFAFTEQGVAMLSGILNSETAIKIHISIIRAFVSLRHLAKSHKDLFEQISELESRYDKQFADVYEALNFLLEKNRNETTVKNRKRIGFIQEDN